MNLPRIEYLTKELLREIGEDVDREGLQGTPNRVARYWQEFIEYDPGNLPVTFEAITTDQMVVVSNIKVWSLCEHHLLPFWCNISVAYIAQQRVIGLSKLARIAHKHAHKLQLQERLVDDIAKDIMMFTGSNDVAVIGEGQHLCMVMRGIKTPGIMKTSAMHGVFRNDVSARAEFLSLIK